jgi:dienelactone hydrolase
MRVVVFAVALGFAAATGSAQQPRAVLVPDDGVQTQDDLYGLGDRGVLSAQGGRWNQDRWGRQARTLTRAGLTVLAINLRGDKVRPDGTPAAEGSTKDNAADVLAAVDDLGRIGVMRVAAVGASLGGAAVGLADAQSKPGQIERVVFLASSGGDEPERLKGPKLDIVAAGDQGPDGPRIQDIKEHNQRAAAPNKLVVVPGPAQAQALFDTDPGPRVMQEILKFVAAP